MLDSKLENAMLLYNTAAETTSSLQDDVHNAIDGSISMNVEALEADLFSQSVQVRR